MVDKDQPELITKLETVNEIFDKNSKRLTVVDIWDAKFQRCRIMDLTKKLIEDKFESNMEKQLAFQQVNKDTYEQFKDAPNTSKAVFRFYKRGELVHELIGANAHEYKAMIAKLQPTDQELDED